MQAAAAEGDAFIQNAKTKTGRDSTEKRPNRARWPPSEKAKVKVNRALSGSLYFLSSRVHQTDTHTRDVCLSMGCACLVLGQVSALFRRPLGEGNKEVIS